MLDDAAHERNLQRLALHFNEVERSSWVFARFTSTAYLQRIRAELVLRLNLQIVDYPLGPTRRDPLAYLDELPPAAQAQRLVVSFTGLEQALLAGRYSGRVIALLLLDGGEQFPAGGPGRLHFGQRLRTVARLPQFPGGVQQQAEVVPAGGEFGCQFDGRAQLRLGHRFANFAGSLSLH